MADTVKPIRALFFVAEFFRLQGSQRSLLALLKRLPRESVEVVVVFPGEGRCTQAYREAGLDVRVLPAPEDLNVAGKALLRLSPLRAVRLFFAKVVGYNRELARLACELRIDLLHFNTPRSILLGGLSALICCKPSILHVRGQLHVLGRTHRFVSQLLASRMILVSDALQAHIYRIFRRKCRTVYTGIDESDIPQGDNGSSQFVPPQLDLDGKLIVCAFGAVCPFKGYHHLIEASKIINERGGRPPAFLAVGEIVDEKYYGHLRMLLERYNVSNFHFLGWQENVLHFYETADVVVLPSIEEETLKDGDIDIDIKGNEGFPRAVLEAMYLGKPVVATRIAGTLEQIDSGESGMLIRPGDPEDLATALETLLGDRSLREEMGRKAALKVRARFGKQGMVEETVRLFRELTR